MFGYNEMGYQYMKLTDYEKAEAAFQADPKIKPDELLPLTNHGIVLNCLNKFSEAEKELRKAIN